MPLIFIRPYELSVPPNNANGMGGTWDSAWSPAVYSNGNLTVTFGGNQHTRSTSHVNSGVTYVEVKYDAMDNGLGPVLGIMKPTATNYSQPGSYGIWMHDRAGHAYLMNENAPATVFGGAGNGILPGDIFGMKIDLTNNVLKFYKNGVRFGGDIAITAGDYYVYGSSPGGQYGVTVTLIPNPAVVPL